MAPASAGETAGTPGLAAPLRAPPPRGAAHQRTTHCPAGQRSTAATRYPFHFTCFSAGWKLWRGVALSVNPVLSPALPQSLIRPKCHHYYQRRCVGSFLVEIAVFCSHFPSIGGDVVGRPAARWPPPSPVLHARNRAIKFPLSFAPFI